MDTTLDYIVIDLGEVTTTPEEMALEVALRKFGSPRNEDYDIIASISNIEGWEDSLDNQATIKRNGLRPRAANGRFIKV